MLGRWDRRFLCALGLAGVMLLAGAATATGQAALDQYVPSDNPGGHRGSPAQVVEQATGAGTTTTPPTARGDRKGKKLEPAGVVSGGPGGPSGSDDGGYPLTTFVVIVAALFLAGLAARYLPRLMRRLRPRPLS